MQEAEERLQMGMTCASGDCCRHCAFNRSIDRCMKKKTIITHVLAVRTIHDKMCNTDNSTCPCSEELGCAAGQWHVGAGRYRKHGSSHVGGHGHRHLERPGASVMAFIM